ncbi:MAG: hypothetical protein PHR71_04275 [Polaromonas sp.]|nr:hypothetical protein [Polaromonas sp.]
MSAIFFLYSPFLKFATLLLIRAFVGVPIRRARPSSQMVCNEAGPDQRLTDWGRMARLPCWRKSALEAAQFPGHGS